MCLRLREAKDLFSMNATKASIYCFDISILSAFSITHKFSLLPLSSPMIGFLLLLFILHFAHSFIIHSPEQGKRYPLWQGSSSFDILVSFSIDKDSESLDYVVLNLNITKGDLREQIIRDLKLDVNNFQSSNNSIFSFPLKLLETGEYCISLIQSYANLISVSYISSFSVVSASYLFDLNYSRNRIEDWNFFSSDKTEKIYVDNNNEEDNIEREINYYEEARVKQNWDLDIWINFPVNDFFSASVGPFTTILELKNQISKKYSISDVDSIFIGFSFTNFFFPFSYFYTVILLKLHSVLNVDAFISPTPNSFISNREYLSFLSSNYSDNSNKRLPRLFFDHLADCGTSNCLFPFAYDPFEEIEFSKNLKGEFNKPVVFHCYWDGKLNEKHIISLRSCYYFNVLNKANRSIILWMPKIDDGGYLFDEARKYAEIKHFQFAKEIDGTIMELYNYTDVNRNPSFFSDVVRYTLLYKYGGCWFDLDIFFLQSFDPIFYNYENEVIVYQWEHRNHPNGAVFISLFPENKKMKKNIQFIGERNKGWGFQEAKLYLDLPLDFLVLPCSWFDPWWREDNPSGLLFDDFFRTSSLVYDLDSFGFAFHWHNNWQTIVEEHSPFQQLTMVLDRKFSEAIQSNYY